MNDSDYDMHSMRVKAERNENAKLQERIKELEKCVAMLNSMVRGGESHSDFSRDMVERALNGREPKKRDTVLGRALKFNP